MSFLISILAVIVGIILIFFVMIQNSKGGGLAAGFSSSNQVMGVRKTTDFLEKATWTLAGTMVVLCLVATVFRSRPVTDDSIIRDEIQNIIPNMNQTPVPDFGTPVPEETGE